MSFLFPLFLAGALAIAIPVALHFLRRDVAPEVPFSAVRLISKSPVERSRDRRLRDLLLLAARVTALLLLALAFARPYAPWGERGTGDIRIIAIDRSLSMSAPGQFEAALRRAQEALDEAGRGERIAVLAFDHRADVVAEPGTAADARAALATLHPGAGTTRYGAMLSRAVEVAQGSAGRLVVISDFRRAGWDGQGRGVLPSALELDLRDVGPPPPNLAITEAALEGDEVRLALHNSGSARDARVRLVVDGREAAARTVQAAAGLGTVRLPWRPPAEGRLTVSVEDPEGVPADNHYYLALGQAAGPSVLIVAPPGVPQAGFYVSRALAVTEDDRDGRRVHARLLAAPEATPALADQPAAQTVVILLSTRGLERRAREALASFVRRGGGLLITAAPEIEPEVLSAIFGWEPALGGSEQRHEGATLAVTDVRHPIFRPFGPLLANVGQVRFTRSWHVRPEGWEVAARFTDGSPALLDRREGAGRVVVFSSDLDRRWNDFPLQPVFVPFLVETVRYLSARPAASGVFTVATVPAGVPAEPGFHPLPDGSLAVVNVDPGETGDQRLTADEFAGRVDRISLEPAEAGIRQVREVESRQSWWQYGLLLVLGTLVAESFLGRPRG